MAVMEKTFEYCPRKRAVQNRIYSSIKGFNKGKRKPNILMLPGPSIKEPIMKIEGFTNRIYCLENNKDVYANTKSQYDELPEYLQNRVRSACGNILDYKSIFKLEAPRRCGIIEADLCDTPWVNSHVLAGSIRDQALNKHRSNKHFIPTVSMRRKGGKEEALREVDNTVFKEIGLEIDVKFSMEECNKKPYNWTRRNGKLKHAFDMLRIKILKRGRLVSLDMYIYKDTSTMMTIHAVYK